MPAPLRLPVETGLAPSCSRQETRQAASLRLLFFLGRNRQPEHRKLALPRYVHPTRIFGTGQIQRLAKFAAIYFGVCSPRFLHAAAFFFEHVSGVEPAFQMSAAELTLFVF